MLLEKEPINTSYGKLYTINGILKSNDSNTAIELSNKKIELSCQISLQCDLLYYISKITLVSDLLSTLKMNIVNQSYYLLKSYLKYNIKPKLEHFSPFNYGIQSSIIFNKDERKLLHLCYGYNCDRCIFTKSNIINLINNMNDDKN